MKPTKLRKLFILGLCFLAILPFNSIAQTWTKLPIHTNLPSAWRSFPSSIDVTRGVVYSVSETGVFWKYNIQSNAFTQLPVSGWPGRVDQFIYNPDENTIWLTSNSRGQVFRLPVAGGAVTSVGSSGASFDDFSNVSFWNPVTHKWGLAFGYGFGTVKNWRWEFGTNNTDWLQVEANVPGREPWGRVLGSAAIDFSGKRLFVYGYQGNSSGSQGQFDAGFSNNGDQFDYLKDLWSFNLNSNQWAKLIPLNTSIPIQGRMVYFPPSDTLFMINGSQTPANSNPSVYVTGLWSFNLGQSTNWTQVSATGDIPNVADELAQPGAAPLATSFYDPANQRVIHFNNKGVYALTVNSFCSPHRATATVTLVNGFVVGTTITDSGCGYTNPPTVLIQGGGGSGATATAIITDGKVTGININNTGCCYTNAPKIVVGSPPFVPTVSISVSKVNVMQHVVLGRNYLLEYSTNLNVWTATGPQFNAQSETIVNEFNVDETGRYFRIREVP